MNTVDATTQMMNDEAAIYGALRNVQDPELMMDPVELGLIKKIDLKADPPTIFMILTTPFCPYGASFTAEIAEAASEALGRDVKVQLLAERWDPRDAGLVW